MAIMPIVRVPEPVLRQKTKKIKKIDASLQKLIDDMIETMHDAPGVGLAANQVGVSLRVCVIHVPGDDVVTLINPEIVRRSGTRECPEGCLSLPGYKGVVSAPRRSSSRASTATAGPCAITPATSSPRRSSTRSTTSTASSTSTTWRAWRS